MCSTHSMLSRCLLTKFLHQGALRVHYWSGREKTLVGNWNMHVICIYAYIPTLLLHSIVEIYYYYLEIGSYLFFKKICFCNCRIAHCNTYEFSGDMRSIYVLQYIFFLPFSCGILFFLFCEPDQTCPWLRWQT